ncbi:epimerase [Pullulanibacillus camelliae]|uniref:Epimerase n=1 Tax=Pullulanibacillus camelliae TaxID=1707096 RepID=A0A8J2YHA1_9BACL|nr:sugar phosphate isomerase/epimerase family protein [Pullulanibacillus camelliae]GGE42219.1 epimerase [Pullulanibacillus camelliae]
MHLAYPVGTPDTHAAFMGFNGDFERNISDIKAIGYKAVELSVRDPDEMDVLQVVNQLKEKELEVAAILATHVTRDDRLTLLSQDPMVKHAAKERLKKVIALASRFGGAPVSIGKFRGSFTGIDKEEALRTLAGIIRELCEYAQKYNVTLLIEPQHAGSINNLNTVAETLAWIESVNRPNLALHLDTFHMETTEASPLQSIVLAGEKIGYIHCSDSDRRIPGEGTIDLGKFFSMLRSVGYEGYIGMEIEQHPSYYQAAQSSYLAMNKLLKELQE